MSSAIPSASRSSSVYPNHWLSTPGPRWETSLSGGAQENSVESGRERRAARSRFASSTTWLCER